MAGAILLASSAPAQVNVYSGYDFGYPTFTPSRATANAAASSFNGATGNPGVITFESNPTGFFSSLSMGAITFTGARLNGGQHEVRSLPSGQTIAIYGYNTTSDGANYISIFTGTLVLSFATPIDAFGAFFTGVQDSTVSLTFSDGSNQSIPFSGVNASAGGIEFLGFTDPGAHISSITINAHNDAIGIDDIRFRAAAPVPEGSTALLLGVGLLVLAAVGGARVGPIHRIRRGRGRGDSASS